MLLLDEPTTGLDPALRLTFYEILDELRRDGATVLISSHALDELEGRAEQVLIMNRGILVADGALAELRALAGLPIRLSLKLNDPTVRPAWVPGDAAIERDRCEIGVLDHTGKMQLLRQAANDPAVVDIGVAEPTLDELYAHFLRQQERAA